jgi:cytoskeleton protein RodZ
MSIGQTLAASRRSAGLTIDDLSAKTRLRATVIRAIEDDDFSLCGGDFYARGHIRTLATLVGADPVALLAEYDATVATADDNPVPNQISETEATGRAISRTAEKRRPKWGLAAIGAALLVVIVLAAVGLSGGHKAANASKTTTATPPIVVSSATPTVSSPPPSPSPALASAPGVVASLPPAEATPTTAVADDGVHVVMAITGAKCWAEVTGSDGSVLYQGVLNPGDSKTFDDPQRISFRLGNAPATDFTVNGVEIGAPQAKSSVTSVSFGPGNPLVAQG